MSEIVATLVTSGVVSSVGVALIGAVSARRPRKLQDADYAKIAAEMNQMAGKMAQAVAEDLREDNQELNRKVDTLETRVMSLGNRVAELTDALWSAIRRLDSHGADATDLRQVLNGHRLD